MIALEYLKFKASAILKNSVVIKMLKEGNHNYNYPKGT